MRRAAVMFAVSLAGLAAAGFGLGSEPPPQTLAPGTYVVPAASTVTVTVTAPVVPLANVWISANGSDSGAHCARTGTPAADPGSGECGTFAKACLLANGGDTVGVAAGSYSGDVNITRDDCSPSSTVTFKCATTQACVIGGYIILGASSGTAAGVGPSYLTFDGLDFASWKSYAGPWDGISQSHVTVTNSHIHTWDNAGPTGGSAPLFNAPYGEPSYFTVSDNEIGPTCCSGDGIEGAGAFMRVTGNYIHDIYQTCRTSGVDPVMIRAPYIGQCAGKGYGDTVNGGCTSGCVADPGFDHVDAIQMEGAYGVTIANNRIYNAGIQGIFLDNAGGWGLNNITVAGNLIGRDPCGCGGDEGGIGISSNTDAGIGGTIKILYNTMQDNIFIGNGSSSDQFAAGTTVIVAGNITGHYDTRNSGGSGGPCTPVGSGATFTYSHNNFGNATCDATDISSAPTYVSADPLTPDLRLSGGQASVNGGESVYCGPGKDVTADLFGTARPQGSACDIGGHEAG